MKCKYCSTKIEKCYKTQGHIIPYCTSMEYSDDLRDCTCPKNKKFCTKECEIHYKNMCTKGWEALKKDLSGPLGAIYDAEETLKRMKELEQ